MTVEESVAQAFRDEWGQVVATLIRVTGDWDLAEECAQDAFALALQRWPRDGVPRRPGAWLTTTARNRAVDRMRRDAVGAAKLREAAAMTHETEVHEVPDERLRLMFTCCHPALAPESRVALTLRTLAGLTTSEIARAFLVGEPAMSKRLLRAKQKIRNAGIPYRVPPAHLLPERTPSVLAVLYLLFNEGYSATAGADLVRRSLSGEAIRLARVLVRLMPDEPEAVGLLALMLLHDARRTARLDDAGELVLLRDQDRSRWDAEEIAEGTALLDGALRRGRHGPYQVQAAIAACHAGARRSRRHRLAADRDALRPARTAGAVAGGGAEPGGRGGHGRRPGRGSSAGGGAGAAGRPGRLPPAAGDPRRPASPPRPRRGGRGGVPGGSGADGDRHGTPLSGTPSRRDHLRRCPPGARPVRR